MSSVTAVRSRPSPGDAVARPRHRRLPPAPQRFAWFASAAVALTSIPYLFVLWDLFGGSVNPLRGEGFDSDFYDMQARAMLAGHLWLNKGAIGIEAFVHGAHEYTYFGIFPSILRLPVLLVTHQLDGRLTAPAILLAWLVTALFSSLLVWRVRVMGRGDAPLGRAEASALGILVGSVTGGSALVYVAATPWVFDEDFAWGVALAIGSLFALLGVLERPSRGRFIGAGALVLALALDRAPIAYGCEIAAIGIAVWLATRRDDPRRWRNARRALAVGIIPLLIAGAVNSAKFGSPFALPMASQIWTSVNAHRRAFLAANGGRAFSLGFIPSTLAAYMNPLGLNFRSVFPYVTMPPTPASAVGGAVLDQTYPTAGIPASMPLLFLLGCWGVITLARRPPRPRQLELARIPLIGAAAGCSGVLLWGYIADRYLADFIPFLILAGAVGLVEVCRRLDGRSLRVRRTAVAAIAVLGVFGVVANMLLSLTPERDAWDTTQVHNYVALQIDLSNITGHPLSGAVIRTNQLPFFAPEGSLYDVSGCSGLYLSSGYSYANVPAQQYEHDTWMAVEEGPSIVSRFKFVFEPSLAAWRQPFTLIGSGQSYVIAHLEWVKRNGTLVIRFGESDPHHPAVGQTSAPGMSYIGIGSGLFPARPGKAYSAVLIADPYLNELSLWIAGQRYLSGPYTAGGPVVLAAPSAGGETLVGETLLPPRPSTPLCDSLSGRSSGH